MVGDDLVILLGVRRQFRRDLDARQFVLRRLVGRLHRNATAAQRLLLVTVRLDAGLPLAVIPIARLLRPYSQCRSEIEFLQETRFLYSSTAPFGFSDFVETNLLGSCWDDIQLTSGAEI